MTPGDWQDPGLRHVCVELRTASGTPAHAVLEYAIFLVFNSGPALDVVLPAPPDGHVWRQEIDSADPAAGTARLNGAPLRVSAQAVCALVLEKVPARRKEDRETAQSDTPSRSVTLPA